MQCNLYSFHLSHLRVPFIQFYFVFIFIMSTQMCLNKLTPNEKKLTESIEKLLPSLFDHNQNFPDWVPSQRTAISSHPLFNAFSVSSSRLENLISCERSSQCWDRFDSNTEPISMSLTWNDTGNARSSSFEDYVQVKSSAHVSYIVGKQGGKIRQIRQETSTFIQTPVNGEEPVFVIRGSEEKVAQAKRKILEESRNFDLSNYLEAMSYNNGDKKRLNLFLPARYIGLVVGRKGSVIKRIMEESETNIITPKVNTLNGFKIYGSEEAIRKAVLLIKHHISSSNMVEIEESRDNEVEITLIIKKN